MLMWYTRPKTLTHTSTNRARRRVTSLLRPTLLPNRQVVIAIRRPPGSSDKYFVGLKKTTTTTANGDTHWLNGDTSTYRKYEQGEPNDDDKLCFYITGATGGKLADEACDATLYYICKITSGLRCNLRSGWPQFWREKSSTFKGLFKNFQLPFPDLFQRCFTTLECYGIT